jgi:transposase
VRVGMEATGYSRWFERLLTELGMELWMGDAAEIKTKRVRKRKTDRQDAQLLLNLMVENRFPRVWIPHEHKKRLARYDEAKGCLDQNAGLEVDEVIGVRLCHNRLHYQSP